MKTIGRYLNDIQGKPSDLTFILEKAEKVVIFQDASSITNGLLIHPLPKYNTRYLFIMPKEDVYAFHTVGMKYNIDIIFFNIHGEIVKEHKNQPPGVKFIMSEQPAKYIVEIPVPPLGE